VTDLIAHRAGWIIATPQTILRNGFIKTAGDKIIEIGEGPISGCRDVIDHGPGVLMPGLVNVHTHLELSALKGKLPYDQGFQTWVQALIRLRAGLSEDELLRRLEKGVTELVQSGCVAVGEISSLGISRHALHNSSLAGVWFYEFLGEDSDAPPIPELRKAFDGRGVSVAGHAPHTTSPTLLKKLKKAASRNGCPFSIHVAESEDEIKFLQTGQGSWADFLTSRGIDFSEWGLPASTPLHYIEQLGLLDSDTILVHLLRETDPAFRRISEHGAYVCLCPRSNRNLHNRLPDVNKMRQAGVKLCLGTDSLASVSSLSLFDEMAFLTHAFPSIPAPAIWEMATCNGAKALGIDKHVGSLEPGKANRMLYASMNVSNEKSLMEMIVNKGFDALKIVMKGENE